MGDDHVALRRTRECLDELPLDLCTERQILDDDRVDAVQYRGLLAQQLARRGKHLRLGRSEPRAAERDAVPAAGEGSRPITDCSALESGEELVRRRAASLE